MYTCGLTVYNYAHIGNLRAYITADLLKRTLIHNSYNVKQVMNITDVGQLVGDGNLGEDKLILSGYYRKIMNFTFTALENSMNTLKIIYQTITKLSSINPKKEQIFQKNLLTP